MLGDIAWAASPTSTTRPPLIVQRGHGRAQADRDPLTQDLVKATAADGRARPGCTPDGRQVHLDQLAAAVIEEPLPGHHAGAAGQRGLQPQRAQRPDRAGRQVHPRARLRPGRGAFHHIRPDAPPEQRPGGGQASDMPGVAAGQFHDHVRSISPGGRNWFEPVTPRL
jgi:hypothetical protein